VKDTLNEVYERLKQSVEIQGFRKGTAPLWLIKARYKDYIREEVGKKIADKTLDSAIRESKLTPVADVYLEKIDLKEKEGKLTYTVSFEVPPEFELKDVEGIEVEIPRVEFNETMLRNKIEQLREEHALWEPVEDRGVKEGDLVTIEYEVQEVNEEGKGEKVSGETSGIIGKNTLREELEKALLGKKAGEEVKLENLPLYNPEGKEIGRANITARIKEVKERKLPEIGEDFARELGYKSWEEAEKGIEEELRRDLERMRKAMIESATAEKLVSMHSIEVPRTLLQREISHMIERKVRELQQFGLDTRYLNYRTMAQEFLPQAEANIKLRYILDRYAQEKGIEVTEEDVERQIKELADQMNTTREEIRDYFEREKLMDLVRSDARRRKALEDIASKVKVVEKETKKEESQDEGNS